MSRSFGFSRPHRPAGGGPQGVVFQPTSPRDRRRPVSHSQRIGEDQLLKGTGFGEGEGCRRTPEQSPFRLRILNKVSRGFRAAAPSIPGPLGRRACPAGARSAGAHPAGAHHPGRVPPAHVHPPGVRRPSTRLCPCSFFSLPSPSIPAVPIPAVPIPVVLHQAPRALLPQGVSPQAVSPQAVLPQPVKRRIP